MSRKNHKRRLLLVPGDQQYEPTLAYLPRDVIRRALRRRRDLLTSLDSNDTTLDLRKRKFGILACDDQVAVEDDLHASTVCAPVDGGDDGLGRCGPPGQRREAIDIADDVLLVCFGPATCLSLVPSEQLNTCLNTTVWLYGRMTDAMRSAPAQKMRPSPVSTVTLPGRSISAPALLSSFCESLDIPKARLIVEPVKDVLHIRSHGGRDRVQRLRPIESQEHDMLLGE